MESEKWKISDFVNSIRWSCPCRAVRRTRLSPDEAGRDGGGPLEIRVSAGRGGVDGRSRGIGRGGVDGSVVGGGSGAPAPAGRPAWWDGVSHAVTRPRPASTSLDPRARTSGRRARGSSDDLGGHPTIPLTAAPGAAAPRTPGRALRPRERRSDRRGPAERKWSAQESTAMSPLDNLPEGEGA